MTKIKDNQTSITKEHYEKKAAQSRENLARGGKAVTIDLHNTVTVQFTEDFGYNRKDEVKTVSETAYEIYKDKGVVTKLS